MPPVTQKLIAGIAVFVIAIGALGAGIYAKNGERAEVEAAIGQINDQIAGYDAIIATRDQKKKHRDAQDEVFKELVNILPQYSERQQERVYEAVTSYGAVAKLKFQGLVPTDISVPSAAQPAGPPPPGPPRPPGQSTSNDFAQTVLALRFEGTFFNFLKFLNMVENHESFLRVDSFQLSPATAVVDGPQPENRDLSITVKISTFHYVQK